MSSSGDRIEKLLWILDTRWAAFKESYSGLSDSEMVEPGVMGDWSIKDILAHVTTWEEEALRYLPIVIEGGRPPRYANQGGIDAFNARRTEEKRSLSLAEVRGQLDQTHRRLIEFIRSVPEVQFQGDTRFRRRLRLDTYTHYPVHERAIREWRARRSGGHG